MIRGAAAARLREHVVEPVAVLSPHLDDAVFSCGVLSCGDLIAASGEAVVATVCAGVPPSAETLTEWDAVCGFGSARQAITARREEDRAALSTLEVCYNTVQTDRPWPGRSPPSRVPRPVSG